MLQVSAAADRRVCGGFSLQARAGCGWAEMACSGVLTPCRRTPVTSVESVRNDATVERWNARHGSGPGLHRTLGARTRGFGPLGSGSRSITIGLIAGADGPPGQELCVVELVEDVLLVDRPGAIADRETHNETDGEDQRDTYDGHRRILRSGRRGERGRRVRHSVCVLAQCPTIDVVASYPRPAQMDRANATLLVSVALTGQRSNVSSAVPKSTGSRTAPR